MDYKIFTQRQNYYAHLTKEIMKQLQVVIEVITAKMDPQIAERTEWRDAALMDDEIVIIGYVPFSKTEVAVLMSDPEVSQELRTLVQTNILRVSIPKQVFGMTNRQEIEQFFGEQISTTEKTEKLIEKSSDDDGDDSVFSKTSLTIKHVFSELSGFNSDNLSEEEMQTILDYEFDYNGVKH
jgi:hypothetical protein